MKLTEPNILNELPVELRGKVVRVKRSDAGVLAEIIALSAQPVEPAATGSGELREQLAAIEHERWADWQKWMHSQCDRTYKGELLIPADLVERWERQINTAYNQLTEQEKDSDRQQVDRYWHLLQPPATGSGDRINDCPFCNGTGSVSEMCPVCNMEPSTASCAGLEGAPSADRRESIANALKSRMMLTGDAEHRVSYLYELTDAVLAVLTPRGEAPVDRAALKTQVATAIEGVQMHFFRNALTMVDGNLSRACADAVLAELGLGPRVAGGEQSAP